MCVSLCLPVSPNIFPILLSQVFPFVTWEYFVEKLKLKNTNPCPLALVFILPFQTGLFFIDLSLHFPVSRSRLLSGAESSGEPSCPVSCHGGREFRARYPSKAGAFCCLLVCAPARSALNTARAGGSRHAALLGNLCSL